MTVFEWLVIILLVLLLLTGMYIAYVLWVMNNHNLKSLHVLAKTAVLQLDRVGSYVNEIGVEVKRVNAHLRSKQ